MRRVKLDKRKRRIVVAFVLAMVIVLGLAGSVGLAGQPQGPWLGMELSLTPGETGTGAKILGTLIVRNLGAEQEMFDAIGARLPEGVY